MLDAEESVDSVEGSARTDGQRDRFTEPPQSTWRPGPGRRRQPGTSTATPLLSGEVLLDYQDLAFAGLSIGV